MSERSLTFLLEKSRRDPFGKKLPSPAERDPALSYINIVAGKTYAGISAKGGCASSAKVPQRTPSNTHAAFHSCEQCLNSEIACCRRETCLPKCLLVVTAI